MKQIEAVKVTSPGAPCLSTVQKNRQYHGLVPHSLDRKLEDTTLEDGVLEAAKSTGSLATLGITSWSKSPSELRAPPRHVNSETPSILAPSLSTMHLFQIPLSVDCHDFGFTGAHSHAPLGSDTDELVSHNFST